MGGREGVREMGAKGGGGGRERYGGSEGGREEKERENWRSRE